MLGLHQLKKMFMPLSNSIGQIDSTLTQDEKSFGSLRTKTEKNKELVHFHLAFAMTRVEYLKKTVYAFFVDIHARYSSTFNIEHSGIVMPDHKSLSRTKLK